MRLTPKIPLDRNVPIVQYNEAYKLDVKHYIKVINAKRGWVDWQILNDNIRELDIHRKDVREGDFIIGVFERCGEGAGTVYGTVSKWKDGRLYVTQLEYKQWMGMCYWHREAIVWLDRIFHIRILFTKFISEK